MQKRNIILFFLYKYFSKLKDKPNLITKLIVRLGNILSIDYWTGYTVLNINSKKKGGGQKLLYPPIIILNRIDNKFYVEPPFSVSNWLPHEYEKGLLHPCLDRLREGDVVIDIGANVGFFSILASERVGKEGKVYSFEPVLETAAILENVININMIKNIILERKALAGRVGKGFIRYSYGGDAFAMMMDKSNTHLDLIHPLEKTRTVEIEITTLDEYLSNIELSNLKLIKIDVEGQEMAVLKSSIKTISRYKPTIICEFWGDEQLKKGEEFFKSIDYNKIYSDTDGKGLNNTVYSPL